MTFPFFLGCTSLTYPEKDILFNLERVQPHFNAVELTLEYPRTLPLSQQTIDKIVSIQQEKGLSVTIHLPLSLQMTSANPHMRAASLRSLEEAFACSQKLNPKAYVLHVTPFFKTGGTPLGRVFEVNLHKDRLEATWKALADLRDMMDPQKIAVENLFHNLVFLEDVIREYDYGVCMDTGHLLLNQADVYFFYTKFQDRIKVIHLHDVVNGQDHQQLGEGQSGFDVGALLHLMRESGYHNTVILEQFRPEHIAQSYELVTKAWTAGGLG